MEPVKCQTDTNTFKCTYEGCEKQFNKKSTFEIHVKKHTNERPFECDVCNKTFKNKSHLRKHKRRHESNVNPTRCTYEGCDAVLSNTYSFKRHIKNRHENLKDSYACVVCNEKFNKKSQLTMHMAEHTGLALFKCDLCGLEFNSKTQYRKHRDQEKKIKRHECTYKGCNAKFKRPSKLVAHMRKHTGERPFECDECDKTYTNDSHLRRHKKTTHRKLHIENIRCPYENCLQICATKDSYKNHIIRRHLNAKVLPYNCDTCHKGFLKKSQLHSHQYQHTGTTPYKCESCKKMFINISDYKRHKYNHKNYECICKQVFDRWSRLLKHKKTCEKCVKVYECKICNKTFHNKSTLNYHIEHHDTDDKPFKCPVEGCARIYKYERNLNVHIRFYHLKERRKRVKCTFPGCNLEVIRLKSHLEWHEKPKNINKIRAPRKDKGISKTRSMALKLAGLTTDYNIEKQIIQGKKVTVEFNGEILQTKKFSKADYSDSETDESDITIVYADESDDDNFDESDTESIISYINKLESKSDDIQIPPSSNQQNDMCENSDYTSNKISDMKSQLNLKNLKIVLHDIKYDFLGNYKNSKSKSNDVKQISNSLPNISDDTSINKSNREIQANLKDLKIVLHDIKHTILKNLEHSNTKLNDIEEIPNSITDNADADKESLTELDIIGDDTNDVTEISNTISNYDINKNIFDEINHAPISTNSVSSKSELIDIEEISNIMPDSSDDDKDSDNELIIDEDYSDDMKEISNSISDNFDSNNVSDNEIIIIEDHTGILKEISRSTKETLSSIPDNSERNKVLNNKTIIIEDHIGILKDISTSTKETLSSIHNSDINKVSDNKTIIIEDNTDILKEISRSTKETLSSIPDNSESNKVSDNKTIIIEDNIGNFKEISRSTNETLSSISDNSDNNQGSGNNIIEDNTFILADISSSTKSFENSNEILNPIQMKNGSTLKENKLMLKDKQSKEIQSKMNRSLPLCNDLENVTMKVFSIKSRVRAKMIFGTSPKVNAANKPIKQPEIITAEVKTPKRSIGDKGLFGVPKRLKTLESNKDDNRFDNIFNYMLDGIDPNDNRSSSDNANNLLCTGLMNNQSCSKEVENNYVRKHILTNVQ